MNRKVLISYKNKLLHIEIVDTSVFETIENQIQYALREFSKENLFIEVGYMRYTAATALELKVEVRSE